MYAPCFAVRCLDDQSSDEACVWVAGELLQALLAIDCAWLSEHPAPPLYDSGIVYRAEARGSKYRDICAVLIAGAGDCEDLACWRAAELIVRDGVDAYPVPYVAESRRDRLLLHVVVQTPWGIEDPSELLGMSSVA
jgi:hypothetical protein